MQILERLKCQFKCRLIRIHGNRIDLIPVVFYEESSAELSAIKVVAYLETLTREMAPLIGENEKLTDNKIEQLTCLLSVYESIVSNNTTKQREQWKILELMKEQCQPIDLFCHSFDERWRCDRNEHRVFGSFPERCLRKTPIFSCYSPSGELPSTSLMTPRLIYDREILLSLRETTATPPKAPLRLLKDLMNNSLNYSSTNTDVVYGNTVTCRAVIVFGDLTAFTAIRDDPLEAQEAAAKEAIDFLQHIIRWMSLNAESSTKQPELTLTRLLTEYPTQLKVFTSSDSTGAFWTSIDVLNSKFVFTGQSKTSPDEATQFAGERLLAFLEKLTTEMNKKKEQASESELKKQAWALLIDRFNSGNFDLFGKLYNLDLWLNSCASSLFIWRGAIADSGKASLERCPHTRCHPPRC